MKPISTHSIPRLGVNIDHIATLRQLRGTPYPNLIDAASIVEIAGADQITVHLREDRRHIQEEDVKGLRKILGIPLNLEMAIAEPVVKFAIKLKPTWCCLVPEKRQEITTEGGLDLKKKTRKIAETINRLKRAGSRVSLFIEPTLQAVRMSAEIGADAIELHTGRYSLACQRKKTSGRKSAVSRELERIKKAAILGRKLKLNVHAGHGLDYENTRAVVDLEENAERLIEEYNIGHSIVCRASIVGLKTAVQDMIAMVAAP